MLHRGVLGVRMRADQSGAAGSTEERGQQLRATAFRGSLWSATYRWSARLVSFATFAILGRLLEPEEFGIVALAAATSEVLGVLVDFGLPRFVVHVQRVDAVFRSTIMWTAVGLGTAIAAVQVAMAPVIAAWLREPSAVPVLSVMAIGYPLAALSGVVSAFHKRELRFRLLAVRGMIAVATSAAVAVSLALAGFGVWALVGQALSFTASSLLVLWVADPWTPRPIWSRAVFGDAMRYGRSALGATAMDVVAYQADRLIIGRRLGVNQLGYYSIASRLVQVVLDMLVSIVYSVAFPILARAQENRALLAAAYRRSVTQCVLVSAPALALLTALMPQLIEIAFGPKWAPVAGVGALLAVSRGLLVPSWFDSALLYAVGRVRTEMWLAGAGAVTLVVAVVAGSSHGLTGVAVALVARSLLLLPLRMVVSCRITEQPIAPLAAVVMRTWAAAGVAGGCALLAASRTESLVLAVVVGSGIGVGSFLGAASLLARGELTYLLDTARRVSAGRGGRHRRP